MSATARATWLDAWEGASTPSPDSYRGGSQWGRDDRYARSGRDYRYERPRQQARQYQTRPAQPQAYYTQREVRREAPRQAPRQAPREAAWRDDWADASEWTGSVVRMSAVRRARGGVAEPYQDRADTRAASTVDDYDWEAAARCRPNHNQCERVILHSDRSIEARISSTRYYGREATARQADPWPEAKRREAAPRLRVVKHRVPRWRLGLLAGVFAVLFVGLLIVAPIMTSSAVAGMESAVGQAEAQQQQLAADTAALSSQISTLSSPQRVAEQAQQLGLVPANDVSYMASGDQMLASEGDTTVAGR